jgi:hypothetical protein
VEALFAEHHCFQHDIWQHLKKARNCVLSQHTVGQYIGFSLNKVTDWKKGKIMAVIDYIGDCIGVHVSTL